MNQSPFPPKFAWGMLSAGTIWYLCKMSSPGVVSKNGFSCESSAGNCWLFALEYSTNAMCIVSRNLRSPCLFQDERTAGVGETTGKLLIVSSELRDFLSQRLIFLTYADLRLMLDYETRHRCRSNDDADECFLQRCHGDGIGRGCRGGGGDSSGQRSGG